MTYNLEFFLEFETQQLRSFESTTSKFSSDKTINKAFKNIHTKLINNLIDCFMQKNAKGINLHFIQNYLKENLLRIFVGQKDFEVENIPQICEMLHISFLNSIYSYSKGKIVRKRSKSNLLEAGAVYTQNQIAYDIVHKTICNMLVKEPKTLKILDFASGTGRFYQQIVKCLSEIFGLAPDFSIINNIYAVDIDPIAINICRLNALCLLTNLDYDKAKVVSEHILQKCLDKNQLLRITWLYPIMT